MVYLFREIKVDMDSMSALDVFNYCSVLISSDRRDYRGDLQGV